MVGLQEGDALGAMEKLCRQLTYHLSPHSQWRRHRGLVKRKPQAWGVPPRPASSSKGSSQSAVPGWVCGVQHPLPGQWGEDTSCLQKKD